jgi:hypothetical protein
MDVKNIIQRIAESTQSDWASEYGNDSRYTQGDGPIIIQSYDMCNIMNKHPRIEQAAIDQGFELVNYDEYTVDHECDKVWRTSPDSYGWTPSVVYTEHGDLITPDSDIDEWIEWAVNEESRCLTSTFCKLADLEELGFVQEPDDDTTYESGLHPGQTDDPAKMYKELRVKFPESDIIFWLKESSQFYVVFQVLRRVQRTTISSNGFSHDTQVQDALDWLQQHHEADWTRITTANPELTRLDWEGSWVAAEEMGLDVDFMSWVADELENTEWIIWDEGEPYGILH